MIALVCLTFSGGQAQNTGMWWISRPNFFTYADDKKDTKIINLLYLVESYSFILIP